MARSKVRNSKVRKKTAPVDQGPAAVSPASPAAFPALSPSVSPAVSPTLLEPARPTPFADAEAWVRAHLDWFVWAIVVAGFWLRFHLAGESYLNSDETQIMTPPFEHGLLAVYKAGLVFPYGPFNNFLLYFMTFFGGSEQYFRMIAAVPGALMAFVGYRWAAYLFGPATGVATACILSFSPSMVNISAEVRHYMMHTFLLVCAMYCLERAFGEQSLKWMRLFGASLLLALLTMYMSIWATAAIGVYALLRIFRRELPRQLVLEWLMIQIAALLVCVIAYTTHLYQLRGSGSEAFARDGWLRGSYYHPETQHLSDFLTTASKALFVYLFGNNPLGIWMIYVFAAGIVLILWAAGRRLSVLSFVLPVMATCAAAILGLYPFGGSRHDAFLIAFVAVPVAVAISFVAGRKVIVVLLAAMILAPYWQSIGQMNYLEVELKFRKLEQMSSALHYLAEITPRPKVLLVDEEGAELVKYYVCHAKMEEVGGPTPDLRIYSCGDYKVLLVKQWSVDASILGGVLEEARPMAPNEFPDPVWVFSVSDRTRITGNKVGENAGQFGRLLVTRVSPPN
jgi:hypothetical protein